MLEIFFAISLFLLGGVVFLYFRSFYDSQNFEVKESIKAKRPKTLDTEKRPVPHPIPEETKKYQKAVGKTIPSLGMEVDCVKLRTIDNTKVPSSGVKSPAQAKLKPREHRPKVKEVENVVIESVDFVTEMQKRAREMNLQSEAKRAGTKSGKDSIGKISAPAIKVNKDLISKSYAWTT
ncbi:D-tyrosyl-tRNA(Tyr) deacylase [Perkinsela sp. CCAP 1560/4]|nr:D-tyrosyl-tRNA(Tyr) deacylase [Perkinsela sp. CCAP 1560/4]|eukprot:KNH04953.1 D-tyrosyl-tRNA(Tyr) deacylase [Perkinsela sp. CCAP 1560/4]